VLVFGAIIWKAHSRLPIGQPQGRLRQFHHVIDGSLECPHSARAEKNHQINTTRHKTERM
jgi:hypothetical protein